MTESLYSVLGHQMIIVVAANVRGTLRMVLEAGGTADVHDTADDQLAGVVAWHCFSTGSRGVSRLFSSQNCVSVLRGGGHDSLVIAVVVVVVVPVVIIIVFVFVVALVEHANRSRSVSVYLDLTSTSCCLRLSKT